jgi:hypothetical protein
MVRIRFTAEPGERRSAQGNGSDVRPSHAETTRGKFWKVLTKMLFREWKVLTKMLFREWKVLTKMLFGERSSAWRTTTELWSTRDRER